MARKPDNMPKRNKKNFRSTKSGAGMTTAGVRAYRRKNPGSKLQTAVTEKNAKGKRAARRKSYCARSLGQLKKSSAKTRNNPNSRIRQARRRWRCQMAGKRGNPSLRKGGPSLNPNGRAKGSKNKLTLMQNCLLYTSPSPRDRQKSRMPSSA